MEDRRGGKDIGGHLFKLPFLITGETEAQRGGSRTVARHSVFSVYWPQLEA